MNCKICQAVAEPIFLEKVLYKYDVQYFQCPNCWFGQTENPYWLDEAYISSMNLSDTGVMLRSERMSKICTSLICLFFDRKGKFLDYAGGFGAFTRTMRDIGFDFYWADPYTKNELARGFDGDLNIKYDILTTFESFEHFVDPEAELLKMLEISDTIILTTDPVPGFPIHKDWWYIAPEHGQHVAFHSRRSFAHLAKKHGLNYHNAMNVHILTRKKINPVGSAFLKFRFAKHLLYLGYFAFAPFLKSKSVSDMNSFYVDRNPTR